MRNDALRVVWQEPAAADLQAIFDYPVALNPPAAEEVVQELVVAGDSLCHFPHRGRRGLAAGTRELVAVPSYLMVYEIGADEVRILRIWHARHERR